MLSLSLSQRASRGEKERKIACLLGGGPVERWFLDIKISGGESDSSLGGGKARDGENGRGWVFFVLGDCCVSGVESDCGGWRKKSGFLGFFF